MIPLLLNPLVFYPLVILLGVLLLALAVPIFATFIAGTLIKFAFIFGGLFVAFLIVKNMANGKVPVITGIMQAVLVALLGFAIPNLLSKLGLQSIIVPTFSAVGGTSIQLPFEIQTSVLWSGAIIAFLLYLNNQKKIGRRL